jgi:hypothetical protein
VYLADSGLYPHSGWGDRIRYNVPRKLIYPKAKISILKLKHIMHQETPWPILVTHFKARLLGAVKLLEVCVYIYIYISSSGVANPDPKELQAKMHNAGIVLGWVTFLALDFWCSLPS